MAEDIYAARDGAELVQVEYDPLPAVVDVEKATAKDADLVHQEFKTNIAYVHPLRNGDIAGAFKRADKVVKQRLVNQRLAPVSMETRSVVAQYLPSAAFPIWITSATPAATWPSAHSRRMPPWHRRSCCSGCRRYSPKLRIRSVTCKCVTAALSAEAWRRRIPTPIIRRPSWRSTPRSSPSALLANTSSRRANSSLECFTTALSANEIVTEARVPKTTGAGTAYKKFAHPASGYAVVGVAAIVRSHRNAIESAAIGVTGVSGTRTERLRSRMPCAESR
ncbi:MAG: molybdopterin cofactor-binding domain-containing protein [Terriglobales bacterium]